MKALNAKSEAIKDTIRTATTPAEIEAAANVSRETVQSLHAQGGTARTLAHQIINLKAYRLEQMSKRTEQ